VDAHQTFPAQLGKAAAAIIAETATVEIGDRKPAGKRSILEPGMSIAHATATARRQFGIG